VGKHKIQTTEKLATGEQKQSARREKETKNKYSSELEVHNSPFLWTMAEGDDIYYTV